MSGNFKKRFELGVRAMKMLRYEHLQDAVGQGVSELRIFKKSHFFIIFEYFES